MHCCGDPKALQLKALPHSTPLMWPRLLRKTLILLSAFLSLVKSELIYNVHQSDPCLECAVLGTDLRSGQLAVPALLLDAPGAPAAPCTPGHQEVAVGQAGLPLPGEPEGWAVGRPQEAWCQDRAFRTSAGWGPCAESRGVSWGASPAPGRSQRGLGWGTRRRGQGAVADSCLYLAVGLEPAQ